MSDVRCQRSDVRDQMSETGNSGVRSRPQSVILHLSSDTWPPSGGLGRAVPLDDAPVERVVVNDPEAAEVIPGDALGAAEVARDFRADFLRDADRLGDRVAAHEVGP